MPITRSEFRHSLDSFVHSSYLIFKEIKSKLVIDYISAHEASHLTYLSRSFSFKPLHVLAIFGFYGLFVFLDSRPALSDPDGQWAEQKKNDPFPPSLLLPAA